MKQTGHPENLDCVGGAPLAHAVDASLLAEIVAWFDVMHSKYVVDGTPVELSEEWPSDWMRRARNVLQSSEDQ